MATFQDKVQMEERTLPEFPKLIFLDTNIVQNLQSFGELIYNNSLTVEMNSKISVRGSRFSEDIYALADFMALGNHAGWPIAISSRTLDELGATSRPDKRVVLINWGEELAYFFASNFDESFDLKAGSSYSDTTRFTFIQRRCLSELLGALPQESDRQLIIDAREYGCDIFVTMDYKTVWRYKSIVSRLGLKVMRPVELLDYVRPWAGLLR